jgi:hypothetical protein
MDQIFIVKLEQEVNSRRYSLLLPIGAPFTEVKEVIAALEETIVAMEKESIERAEKAKAESEQVATEPAPEQPVEG